MTTKVGGLEGAIESLAVTALKVKAERDKYYDALNDILFELDNSRVALDGCSDINENGGPNWAMKLLLVADRYEDLL